MIIRIVEDDGVLRDSLRELLTGAGYAVEAAASLREARMLPDAPQLWLVDLMLPDGSGLALCRELRAVSETPILILTALDAEDDVIAGLAAGADDYITKPFNVMELKARIKAVMRRVSYSDQREKSNDADPGIIAIGSIKLDTNNRRCYINGREYNLTSKEFDILALLCNNPNMIFSREKLLKIVWGSEYPGDVRTVDVHVRRLREKIEPNPGEPSYVHTKWGVGYFYGE